MVSIDIEDVRKRVKVLYFKKNGEIYRTEEEFIVGVYSQEGIVQEVINKVRYKGLDFVILDGEDGVRPVVQPQLVKYGRALGGSKGFGQY